MGRTMDGRSDFFEFLKNESKELSELRTADDVLSSWKLMNSRYVSLEENKKKKTKATRKSRTEFSCCRSTSTSSSALIIRSFDLLWNRIISGGGSTEDYERLLPNGGRRSSQSRSYELERSLFSGDRPSARRSRLAVLAQLFGPPMIKMPRMELEDLKFRQKRQLSYTGSPFKEESATATSNNGGAEGGGGISWKLIRALSCRANESTNVASSLSTCRTCRSHDCSLKYTKEYPT